MVQRYNQCDWCGGEYSPNDIMQKADDGEYVKYSDYEIVQAINSHEKFKGYFKNIILTAEGITGNAGDDDVLIAGIIDMCKQALKEAEKPK